MTAVYITIDTEYSAGLAVSAKGGGQAENFARSIACETPGGAVGIEYQMNVMDRHGLKAVFFVDPMPALLWGNQAIADVVGPIIERGHDVQMHIHTEWLALANERGCDTNPLEDRIGGNMADFTFEDQVTLMNYARDQLIEAGAPAPVAFRAGNYGANDDTLRALKWAGMRYDTSHSPAILDSVSRISLGPDDRQVMNHAGAIEVPIGCVGAFGESLRHAQITALSAWELLSAIRHARDHNHSEFTLVSHSFELVSRDRSTINQIVKYRFDRLCRELAQMEGVTTALYCNNPPHPSRADGVYPVLPLGRRRTFMRMAEQAISNTLYARC